MPTLFSLSYVPERTEEQQRGYSGQRSREVAGWIGHLPSLLVALPLPGLPGQAPGGEAGQTQHLPSREAPRQGPDFRRAPSISGCTAASSDRGSVAGEEGQTETGQQNAAAGYDWWTG